MSESIFYPNIPADLIATRGSASDAFEGWTGPSENLWHFENTFPFSMLRPFMTILETECNGLFLSMSRQFYWAGPISAVLYCVLVIFGRIYMKDKVAFDLRKWVFRWNVFLAIFSTLGTIRLVPQFVALCQNYGLSYLLNMPPALTYKNGTVGFFTNMFIFSKYFELVDTLLIVLRKRKLYFLHWYHHAIALLFTWDAGAKEQSAGIIYAAMNYSVHSVMYTYYALAMVGPVPAWGSFITTIQILQMVFGMVFTSHALYQRLNYHEGTYFVANELNPSKYGVPVDLTNAVLGIVLYTTFSYLFIRLFYHKYILNQPELSHDNVVETVSDFCEVVAAKMKASFPSLFAATKESIAAIEPVTLSVIVTPPMVDAADKKSESDSQSTRSASPKNSNELFASPVARRHLARTIDVNTVDIDGKPVYAVAKTIGYASTMAPGLMSPSCSGISADDCSSIESGDDGMVLKHNFASLSLASTNFPEMGQSMCEESGDFDDFLTPRAANSFVPAM